MSRDAIALFCQPMSRKRRTAADEPFFLVRTSTADLGAGGVVASHAHDWHQLVHVRSGLMTVRTVAGSWIAPPTWAIWVPARTDHSIRFTGASALRTCYVRPDWAVSVPSGCTALSVSPLLRELIARATTVGMLDRRVPAEAAIAALIVEELGEPGPPPFTLPEPTSPVTRHAARLIIEDAPSAAGTATLAREVGVGVRTLERRFVVETGMTLGRWRQQRMLLRGLERVAGGTPIKTASASAGYGSPSAYIAAFKKAFGATPARYFQAAERDGGTGAERGRERATGTGGGTRREGTAEQTEGRR
jgi:AraC-like DNA-binding protein